MKDRVVCVKEFANMFSCNRPLETASGGRYPEKGEIYEVAEIVTRWDGKEYYIIPELNPDNAWHSGNFRPIDDTYGPAVCQTIEEQIQLEEVITI